MKRALILIASCALISSAPPAHADPTLELVVTGGGGPVLAGDFVFVTLTMHDLAGAQAAGFQAFLEYDPAALTFVFASYTPAPFGQPIITPITPVAGEIDLAAGIIPGVQPPTTANAGLVAIGFIATQFQCEPQISFRDHNPPTRITDEVGMPIGPLQLVGVVGPETCPEDLSGDGFIDSIDLNILLAEFASGPCGDIDGDNDTDSIDLNLLLAVFGNPC